MRAQILVLEIKLDLFHRLLHQSIEATTSVDGSKQILSLEISLGNMPVKSELNELPTAET